MLLKYLGKGVLVNTKARVLAIKGAKRHSRCLLCWIGFNDVRIYTLPWLS